MKFGGVGYKSLMVAVTVAISACGGGGGSKNPASGYKLTERPISNDKPADQAIYSEALAIDVDGNPNSTTVVQFMEGQEGSAKLTVRVLQANVEAVTLASEGMPGGATLAPSGEANSWIFRWKPTPNYVASGQSASLTTVKFIARVTKAADDRLLRLGTTQSLPIIVTKNLAQPQIAGVFNIEGHTAVSEGEMHPFSIEINDPTGSPTAPRLSITGELPNKENFKADGAALLGPHPTAPASQSLGGGKWRFNYIIDLRPPRVMPIPYNGQGQPDPSADSVKACFRVAAVSGVQTASVEIPVCFKVVFAVRNPEVQFPAVAPKFTVNAANEMKFSVSIPGGHGLAKINVDEVNKSLSKWDGGASLSCPTNGSASAAECTLTWQPTCKAKSSYELKIKASNSGKRSKDFSQKIEVVKPEGACVEAQKATAPAKETAVKKDEKSKSKSKTKTKTQAKAKESRSSGGNS